MHIPIRVGDLAVYFLLDLLQNAQDILDASMWSTTHYSLCHECKALVVSTALHSWHQLRLSLTQSIYASFTPPSTPPPSEWNRVMYFEESLFFYAMKREANKSGTDMVTGPM
ncbi:hypothetical protein CEXT_232811 [Caerostris extrusa]|uniref:Uncharacterized protein n=1 Tax=Caerostris extrusa TaxID=172846 RepID=A0AAV4XBK8_CAEEX|nr:hypothetical protein CEXT_232811 [Caerostris extrusa]